MRSRSRRGLVAAVSLVAAASVVGALGWYRAGQRAAAPPPPAPAAATQAAAAPATAAPAPQAATPPPVAAPASSLAVRVTVPARVELDGLVVGESTRALLTPLTAPGPHRLLVSAPGYRPYRENVVANAEGGRLELDVHLERTPSSKTPPARHPSGSHRQREDMLDPFAQP